MVKSKSSVKNTKKSVLNKTIDFFINSAFHAYLVGGYVRDNVLGIEPLDIDIVVEGNAIKAARKLKKKLKGKLEIHRDFGTASVVTRDKRIDLASARIEKYPSPGKLPHVLPATIIEDLNRRDFTINAMAMSIAPESFGEIIDPFNGLDDIKKGLIRVLHRNSFRDDPTRIFRALRYKNRFNFRLEKTTRQFMKEALEENMIKHLSGQRILNEIRLIFKESTFTSTVKDMSDLGIFKFRRQDLSLLPQLDENGIYLYLASIHEGRLPLSVKERKIVKHFGKMTSILGRLERASRNSALYNILEPLCDEVIESIPKIRPGLIKKVSTFKRLIKRKPFITGADLKRIGYKPGRKFTNILKKMFDLQLNGNIRTKKQARLYLKKSKR